MFISFKVMILVLFYILDNNNYPDANTNNWYFHHNA